MANLVFDDIHVSGLAACVPKKVIKNSELTDLFPPEDIDKTVNSIGIFERRESAPDVCASDLCAAAANHLLDSMAIDRETIDVLLFMSQTGDYLIPATSPALQARLGLPTTCACMDINLGCSGYLYALATAFTFASQPHVRRVLLLDGETFTKKVSIRDKVNAPLYGDAGTATLIEKGGGSPAYFTLNSDGAGTDKIQLRAGGCRVPVTPEALLETEREDANYRSDCQLFMDGMDVFNFTMKAVPRSVMETLALAGCSLDEIDHLVFHQANKFMTDFFGKKLKCPKTKIPYSIGRFGNTSSASIPLTLASELGPSLAGHAKVLLSAFGAGLSWGGAVLEFSQCQVPELIEL